MGTGNGCVVSLISAPASTQIVISKNDREKRSEDKRTKEQKINCRDWTIFNNNDLSNKPGGT